MKKTTWMLAVLFMLALAGGAHAGERAGAVSVSPYVGGYVFDDDDHNGQQWLRRNRPTYGVRLGYDLTDNFEAELVGSYTRAERAFDDRHFNVWTYHLDLLYNMMPHSTVVPYLAVGGGGITLEYPHPHDQGTDGAVNGGLGFKFFFTDDLALRIDGRYIVDFSYKRLDNWEYSAGMTFVFGGNKSAAEEVTQPAAAPAQPTPPPPAPPAGEAPLAPVPAAEPTPGHYKYCVTLHIEFDIDRALIRPEYRDEVAKVGDFMRKYPSTTAVIEGHTDNVGTYEHNMDLSQRRAQAVVDYMVTNFGIDRSRLTARGYGFSRPVADNATDEGKQKNRRIEAVIDCAFDVNKLEPPEKLCMTLVMDFDTGKADVKPEYRNEIAKVAQYMKQYPATTAVIEGHTDNVGNPDENMKLSQERAENVVNYLVDNFGIERSRLSAKGYGATRRISYNNTTEGRAANRRINAVIDCVIKR
ncbi:OmpA family protein [Geomonas sp. Red32]|uniref:OmpA family protein n=1 Tax=Geomonas sp. Red32 TaxID=2912856 RepID=UPI00202CC825|nr:OmpA family protein [Geomonas sp. Red32]MCM0084157.1 OmpA family protein [Geomonas sp. Red32]